MKTKDVRPVSYIKQFRCDRCDRTAEIDDIEFGEFSSIEYVAGLKSAFGEGNTVAIDLCQHCLKETLGEWIRVTPAK